MLSHNTKQYVFYRINSTVFHHYWANIICVLTPARSLGFLSLCADCKLSVFTHHKYELLEKSTHLHKNKGFQSPFLLFGHTISPFMSSVVTYGVIMQQCWEKANYSELLILLTTIILFGVSTFISVLHKKGNEILPYKYFVLFAVINIIISKRKSVTNFFCLQLKTT